MNDVAVAEHKSRARAWLFYLMAAVLALSAWLGVGEPLKLDRVVVWLFMATVIAANLLPVARLVRRTGSAQLLDDEGVRDHRRTAFTVGFWSALVAAAGAGLAHSLDSFDVARLVITAGLAAALVAFATLELRAARG